MPDILDELLEAARLASRSAYCPYSNFHVGAAILADGRIFTGSNVENASYGLTDLRRAYRGIRGRPRRRDEV